MRLCISSRVAIYWAAELSAKQNCIRLGTEQITFEGEPPYNHNPLRAKREIAVGTQLHEELHAILEMSRPGLVHREGADGCGV